MYALVATKPTAFCSVTNAKSTAILWTAETANPNTLNVLDHEMLSCLTLPEIPPKCTNCRRVIADAKTIVQNIRAQIIPNNMLPTSILNTTRTSPQYFIWASPPRAPTYSSSVFQ